MARPSCRRIQRASSGERCVLGDEDVLLEPVARPVVDALDPPGGVGRDLDPRLALHVAELPLGAAAVALDVELGRQPEIALAPRRKANVRADARDPERADVLALEVVADHVPRAVLGQQRVRVERPLLLVVAVDRPVAELHRPLLGDGAFELAEAALQLGRVVGVAHLDAPGGAGGRRREIARRTAERQVLEREPEGLGVGEAALEEVEAGLERRELVVVELELRQEVALRAQGVELLAGELVTLRVERHAERHELGTVRVEAARERLVAHLLIALDVRLDVARCQRSPLRHQERDQRELANQFVGVVAHPEGSSLADRLGAACARRALLRSKDCRLHAATLLRSRCWCDGQYSRSGSGVRWHGLPLRVVARQRDTPPSNAPASIWSSTNDTAAVDSLGHGPGDLGLRGDREEAADVLEQRLVGLREVVRIGGEPLHRSLAGREHLTPVFDLHFDACVRVDQVFDRAIDRS